MKDISLQYFWYALRLSKQRFKKRRKTQKTILERKSDPTFDLVIEINQQNIWTIHENVKTSIDLLLRGDIYLKQVRFCILSENVKILTQQIDKKSQSFILDQKVFYSQTWGSLNKLKDKNKLELKSTTLIIYAYSISNNLLKEVLLKLQKKQQQLRG